MKRDEGDARARLAEVEEARRRVLDGGRPEAVAKRRAAAKLTARERVAALLDEGSFREIGALVEPARDSDFNRDLVAPADGVVTGTGLVDGRPVAVLAHDYTVLGGSSGKNGRDKANRTIEQATAHGLPLVMLVEGGGHRIQDGQDSHHFAGAGPVFQLLARNSGWTPTIAAMMGQGFAGPTNYAALSDFVVMLRGASTMGMAGPALVKAGTGEEIDNRFIRSVPPSTNEATLREQTLQDQILFQGGEINLSAFTVGAGIRFTF